MVEDTTRLEDGLIVDVVMYTFTHWGGRDLKWVNAALGLSTCLGPRECVHLACICEIGAYVKLVASSRLRGTHIYAASGTLGGIANQLST